MGLLFIYYRGDTPWGDLTKEERDAFKARASIFKTPDGGEVWVPANRVAEVRPGYTELIIPDSNVPEISVIGDFDEIRGILDRDMVEKLGPECP